MVQIKSFFHREVYDRPGYLSVQLYIFHTKEIKQNFQNCSKMKHNLRHQAWQIFKLLIFFLHVHRTLIELLQQIKRR